MENFKDIIGYDSVKLELERIIDCINNKEKYNELGVKIPKNLLLLGEPGVGKTSIAKSFINSLNRNKYIIRKNKPDGEFVNEINKIMTEAIKNAPSVVLLDDLDKFSNTDDTHRNSDEFVSIQAYIDECKDKDVYIIATTNSVTDMPVSVIRPGRFEGRIQIENPTLKDSIKIVKHYLSDKQISNDVDYEEIARILDGGTCALLEDVINEAGLIAGFNGRKLITMDDIIKASLRVIYDAVENLDDKTETQIKFAATHEVGHTVLSEILEPGSVNLVSIANYFGNKGGITSHTNDENYWVDFTKMENRIIVLLGGKAATEVVLNKIDTGCKTDIERAKRILSRFYEDYGIDSFNYTSRESGPDSYNNKTIWIKNELNKYYIKAKELLKDNLSLVNKMIDLLANNKTIVRKEIDKIMGGEYNND